MRLERRLCRAKLGMLQVPEAQRFFQVRGIHREGSQGEEKRLPVPEGVPGPAGARMLDCDRVLDQCRCVHCVLPGLQVLPSLLQDAKQVRAGLVESRQRSLGVLRIRQQDLQLLKQGTPVVVLRCFRSPRLRRLNSFLFCSV